MLRIKPLLLSVVLLGGFSSCQADDEDEGGTDTPPRTLQCVAPAYLKEGDKVALISPGYATSMENVTKTEEVLRRWGLEPVVGPNVGKTDAGHYGGTIDERLSDLRWAINDPDIKAIICNRGGYGAIHLVERMPLAEMTANPKWLVGFSDITTLHAMEANAGVMSIHGTMSSFLAAGGRDATSTIMRDLLMGKVPTYHLPSHPQNQMGHGKGVLVGGNICTFTPLMGSPADITSYDDIFLFVEEVGETMHNIDRLFNMLQMTGTLSRCRGVVLGEFTSCSADLDYESVEAMVSLYLSKYNIPVACGFPGGHGDINLPLVMGAPVTIDVTTDGATLTFDIKGDSYPVNTADITTDPVE